VYVRAGFDLLRDRRTSKLWLLDSDGSNHRPVTAGEGSSPRWSPTGDRIAFVAADGSSPTDGVQLHMHWLSEGRTTPLTQLTQAPSRLTWSPDGRWLAFVMLAASESEPLVKAPTPPEGAQWAPAPKVIDTLLYRRDGTGYRKDGYSHVFIVPADGGAPRQITTGDFHHTNFTWTPDSKALIVSANRRRDWEHETLDSNLYRFPLDGSGLQQLTDRYGPDGLPSVSPDGRRIAYVGFDDHHRGYQRRQLYVLDTDTGERTALTAAFDRSVTAPQWHADGESVYAQYDDQGMGKVALITLAGKHTEVVSDLGGVRLSRPYTGGSFHSRRGAIVYTRSSAQAGGDSSAAPAEVGFAHRGKTATLTDLNQDVLDHKTLATIETVRVDSSADGRSIQAWVAKPPGFETGKRYPTILEIHGGPFAAYGPHFAAEVELYAAAGFLVVYANPRGSASYGEEFANLIHHAYPGDDYFDLMSVVDHVITSALADPERLFVTGGSGGGALTAWIVTQTDRFRAAVAAKPVINWYSFVLTADMYSFFYRYWFPDLPWKVPEAYLERSPISYVDRVKTPTMLLTGEQDYRTPISESEQFYQALKLAKVDAALVRIPDSSHSIAARPSHLIAKVAHVLAWFDRYDKSGSGVTGAGHSQ
jgi:acylaminoacyl-peptidase